MATTAKGVMRETSSHDFGKEEKRVIFASSLGTVFEWYDFYLYATLAPFFAALFFPPGNETAALLSAFATYAAAFLVRPCASGQKFTPFTCTFLFCQVFPLLLALPRKK